MSNKSINCFLDSFTAADSILEILNGNSNGITVIKNSVPVRDGKTGMQVQTYTFLDVPEDFTFAALKKKPEIKLLIKSGLIKNWGK